MSECLAIDPGTRESAYVWLLDGSVVDHGKVPNRAMLSIVHDVTRKQPGLKVVCEMIASYGASVGSDVFETCIWIGRYLQACECEDNFNRVTRVQVKVHHCHRANKVTDSVVRQAMIDRYGGKDVAIGRSKVPGPLFGLRGDEWAALAVGLAWLDTGGNFG